MNLFGDGKLVLIIVLVAVLVYLTTYSSNKKSEPFHNDGALAMSDSEASESLPSDDNSVYSDDTSNNTNLAVGDQKLVNKMKTRDSAKRGYKESSYAANSRGQTLNSMDDIYGMQDPFGDDGNFSGIDETGGNKAAYVPGRQTKLSEKDKFDAKSLLPDETAGKDWFHNAYSSTSVKNRHLINVYRSVGVNTVQGTLKNPSRDIRGNIVVPKSVVSPFLNSSYEPDANTLGLCGKR
jgi:hypothetical protein